MNGKTIKKSINIIKELIKKEMDIYESARNELNQLSFGDIPLYQYTAKDVAKKIKWWIYNDRNNKNP